jgi:hypothetical protein
VERAPAWHARPPLNQRVNGDITSYGASFADNAPLWTYVLAEAQHQWTTAAGAVLETPAGAAPDPADGGGKRGGGGDDDARERAANTKPVHLGPVGGRIVAETIIGLLLADSFSFLSQDPGWKPNTELVVNGRFDMPALVAAALASSC